MATKSHYKRESITSLFREVECSAPSVTCRNVATFILCLMVYGCCNMTLSLFGPFFPIEAEARGASSVIVGAVVSTYPMCVIIASPILGYYLPKIGVKFTLLAGILLVGGSYFIFGFLHWLNGTTFIIFCFLLAFVGGIGSAMLQTSIYALIGMMFSGHYGLVMGLTEVAVGLGYAAGAPVGGALYQIGGFQLPFLVVGSIPLLFLPILHIIVVSPTDACETNEPSLQLFGKALNNCVIICLILSTITGTMTLSFSTPIFSPFMYTQFHLSVYQIGLISLIDAGTYLLLCLVTGPLYDRLPPKPFIVVGLLMCSIGCFLLGPAPYISKPHLWLTMLADGILGMGVALTIAPAYSAMMEVARSQSSELSTNSITMFVSGIIPAATSCGELAGPLVAGGLDGILSFEECSAIFGEASLAMAVLLVVILTIDRLLFTSSAKKHNVNQLLDETKLEESRESKKNYNTFVKSDVQRTIL